MLNIKRRTINRVLSITSVRFYSKFGFIFKMPQRDNKLLSRLSNSPLNPRAPLLLSSHTYVYMRILDQCR